MSDTPLRLPTATEPDRSWFYGAFVFEPKPGKWRNVVYPDYSSLYPNRMRGMNMCLTTLVGSDEELAESEWTENDVLRSFYDPRDVKMVYNDGTYGQWQEHCDPEKFKAVRWQDTNGQWHTKWSAEPRPEPLYYLKPEVREGWVANEIDGTLGLKEKYRGTSKYNSVKANVTNATYGYFGYKYSRLFNWRMAESVTLSSRMILKWGGETFTEYITEECGVDATVVGGDTDSIMTSIHGATTRDEAIRLAKEAAEYVNDRIGEFMKERFWQDEHFMEIEMESYSPSAYLHDAKKRYATWVTWEDGEDLSDEMDKDSIYYGTPSQFKKAVGEINVKGFEMVRSDVSDIAQEVQQFTFETILKEADQAAQKLIYEYLRDVMEDVRNGEIPLERLGVRSGIGQDLLEYGNNGTKRRQPVYRGSLYANEHIPGENIGEGSKPMAFPVERVYGDRPDHYTHDGVENGDVVDAVAVEDSSHLDGVVKLDYEKIIEKQIKGVVEDILDNVGMNWDGVVHGHEQGSLEGFM